MVAPVLLGFLTSSGEEIERASGQGRSSRGVAREWDGDPASLKHLRHPGERRAGWHDDICRLQGEITRSTGRATNPTHAGV